MSAFQGEDEQINAVEGETVAVETNATADDELPVKGPATVGALTALPVPSAPKRREFPEVMIDASQPLNVIYCGVCSMPPEFCEYGACYDRCRPWIEANCPEVLGLSQALGAVGLESGGEAEEMKKMKRGGGAQAPRKAAQITTKIVIARIQRQKKKFITSVIGLDTIPDVKIKDVAKLFGKKFSSGASVGETALGVKEVTVQGDVSFDVPPLLLSEYRVDPKAIFFQDDPPGSSLRPYSL